MSDAAIYIRWGSPFPGRETKSLEVFNHVLEYNARLQAEKKITAHRTYLATNGNAQHFGGFMVVEGDIAQLRAVLDSPEFQSNLMKAQHLVGDVEVLHFVTGNAIGQRVELVLKTRHELGIV